MEKFAQVEIGTDILVKMPALAFPGIVQSPLEQFMIEAELGHGRDKPFPRFVGCDPFLEQGHIIPFDPEAQAAFFLGTGCHPAQAVSGHDSFG